MCGRLLLCKGVCRVLALWSDSALALGPRSTGLGKMVQEPRTRFKVAKWGVFVIKTRNKLDLLALSKFTLSMPFVELQDLAQKLFSPRILCILEKSIWWAMFDDNTAIREIDMISGTIRQNHLRSDGLICNHAE